MQAKLRSFGSLDELKKQFFHFQKGEVMALERKLNMGMVGGGKDAFIGAVHRLAARMDDEYEFVTTAEAYTDEAADEDVDLVELLDLGLDPIRVAVAAPRELAQRVRERLDRRPIDASAVVADLELRHRRQRPGGNPPRPARAWRGSSGRGFPTPRGWAGASARGGSPGR